MGMVGSRKSAYQRMRAETGAAQLSDQVESFADRSGATTRLEIPRWCSSS